MISCSQIDHLYRYPDVMWAKRVSDRWVFLCDSLRQYDPPQGRLLLARERKWELVSAFQKSIRRGEKEISLYLLSAIDGMPEEHAYFWRRFCVIACEDVGPADDTLAAFVVACSTVFPPKKTGSKNYDLFCFLAEQMCDLSTRSRIYCSYGVIEPAAMKCELPELRAEDEPIVSAIMHQTTSVKCTENSWLEWQRKNDWRAEGLLRFVGLTLPLELTRVQTPVPPYKMLFDLPSFCYDMHTRVGLKALQRLVKGTAGADGIRDFFRENKIGNAHRALGMALFFAEGGRIKGELIYESLCCLEQRLFAHQYGLPLNTWLELRVLVEKGGWPASAASYQTGVPHFSSSLREVGFFHCVGASCCSNIAVPPRPQHATLSPHRMNWNRLALAILAGGFVASMTDWLFMGSDFLYKRFDRAPEIWRFRGGQGESKAIAWSSPLPFVTCAVFDLLCVHLRLISCHATFGFAVTLWLAVAVPMLISNAIWTKLSAPITAWYAVGWLVKLLVAAVALVLIYQP